jgi:predicted O-methyltransferase YrrM
VDYHLKMAHHGYISLVKQFLHQLPADRSPSIMEIGVDRGVTFLSLVTFLARTRKQFLAIGVDIFVQEAVEIMLQHLDLQQSQTAYLLNNNSLTVLPEMVSQQMKFDVILLDGDHNYHTVSSELKSIEKLVHDHSIIIIDDYDGRWSERDLWYAERPGYENNTSVTTKVETDKHGVKPAVDEWLSAHPEWHKTKPMQGEPVLLTKQVV